MALWTPGAVRIATDELREYIGGKRIALMMNSSALDSEGRTLIDRIAEEKWADIAFLFGMEHGVRGNLYGGDGRLDACDARTGLPIVNLYRYPGCKPPVEPLREVDAVVFCAQDVGVRHWTYTPWMMTLIDSANEAGCEVIVLDRPNPLRGDIVEGEPARAYVGKGLLSGFEYPLRHGMTIGELALMYRACKKPSAKVTVLKMRGWRREMWYEDTGLAWIPPSPNMPTVDTALYFAATGLMQAVDFSLGIGTTTPFQYVGGVDFDGCRLADALNAKSMAGIYFLQKYYQASTYRDIYDGKKGETVLCDGVLMVIRDRNAWRPVGTQLAIMDTVRELFGDRVNFEYHSLARPRMCTDEICDALAEGRGLSEIAERWERAAEEFKQARAPYLLY